MAADTTDTTGTSRTTGTGRTASTSRPGRATTQRTGRAGAVRAGAGRPAARPERTATGAEPALAEPPASEVLRPAALSAAPDCRVEIAVPGVELFLSGRLGVAAAADVRLALAAAVEAGAGDLVVDVSGVQAVDATGLGVLVGGHRRAGRAGRTLVLRDVPPAVSRLLFLTRLDRVLSTSRTATAV